MGGNSGSPFLSEPSRTLGGGYAQSVGENNNRAIAYTRTSQTSSRSVMIIRAFRWKSKSKKKGY